MALQEVSQRPGPAVPAAGHQDRLTSEACCGRFLDVEMYIFVSAASQVQNQKQAKKQPSANWGAAQRK